MNILEAMSEVESHRFAARLNISSDQKTFLRAARMEESVSVLFDEMISPDKQAQVLSRIMRISKIRVDRRYENPWDVSLAIYIWIMTFTNLEFAKGAAQFIEQVDNSWWAKQIADQLLSARHIHTTAGVHEASRHFTVTTTNTAPSWEALRNTIIQGIIQPIASSVVIRNIQENSIAGEMIVSSGFQGIDTMLSASLCTGSPGSVNNESGWLGQARPPYTTHKPYRIRSIGTPSNASAYLECPLFEKCYRPGDKQSHFNGLRRADNYTIGSDWIGSCKCWRAD